MPDPTPSDSPISMTGSISGGFQANHYFVIGNCHRRHLWLPQTSSVFVDLPELRTAVSACRRRRRWRWRRQIESSGAFFSLAIFAPACPGLRGQPRTSSSLVVRYSLFGVIVLLAPNASNRVEECSRATQLEQTSPRKTTLAPRCNKVK